MCGVPLVAMAWATASWTPGLDNPLIHRGPGGRLCDQARLLVGNLLWHVRRSETLRAHIVETMSASAAGGGVPLAASATGDRRGGRQRATGVHNLVAHWLGMYGSLVFLVEAGFDREGWAWKPIGIRARHKHKKAEVSGRGKRRRQFNGGSSTLISTLATGNAGGKDEGRTDEASCLPALPIDEIFLDAESGLDGTPRSRNQLESWRAHPNYGPAMLHAELSVFWLTAGLPGERWADFLAWLRTKASPGSVADINCSHHWLDEFGMSLCQIVSSRTAGSLHAVVPALGLPSDFVRVTLLLLLVSVRSRWLQYIPAMKGN